MIISADTALPLWEEPARSHRERVVTDGNDRVAWYRARSAGITATDAARLSGPGSVNGLIAQKRFGDSFTGNAYTEHGRRREPVIAAWASAVYGMQASRAVFHAEGSRRHLATPDGWREREDRLELLEIKTSSSAWTRIPRAYLRQIWWQQYVLGAERTLLLCEVHEDFEPVAPEPECHWVDRDELEIRRLVALADEVLRALDR